MMCLRRFARQLRWRASLSLLRLRKDPRRAFLAACLGLAFVVAVCVSTAAPISKFFFEPPYSTAATTTSRPWYIPPRPWPRNGTEIRDLLDRIYEGFSAYTLPEADIKRSSASGHFFQTYGEFTPEGVDVLLSVLNVSHEDIFCDLGSGAGKVVMQALLERQPKEAVGIELSEERHRLAEEARKRLWSAVPTTSGPGVRSQLRYVHGDVLASSLEISRCNKIFFCSTVWPKDLLEHMEQEFLKIPFQRPPVLLASSRELKAYGAAWGGDSLVEGARFVRHAKVDTSWGASFITLYALKEPPTTRPPPTRPPHRRGAGGVASASSRT